MKLEYGFCNSHENNIQPLQNKYYEKSGTLRGYNMQFTNNVKIKPEVLQIFVTQWAAIEDRVSQ